MVYALQCMAGALLYGVIDFPNFFSVVAWNRFAFFRDRVHRIKFCEDVLCVLHLKRLIGKTCEGMLFYSNLVPVSLKFVLTSDMNFWDSYKQKIYTQGRYAGDHRVF